MSRKSDKQSGPSRTAAQAEFAFKINGGARPGSGRKRSGPRPLVPHRERGRITSHVPALVTVRLIPGLASLRQSAEIERVRSAMRAASRSSAFGVVHYTIQSNHLHLIVEAHDRPALSAGMKGLLVRIARGLNRAWRRHGSIFADHYHVRALRTPREVRNALVYVLHNARKHGIAYTGADPCSSGPWFDGWACAARSVGAQPVVLDAGGSRGQEPRPPRITKDVPRDSRTSCSAVTSTGGLDFGGPELSRARSWLLAVGWKRHGLIGLSERPAAQRVPIPRRSCAR
jgi:REP element-mobilizing transposase RayT